MCLRDKMTWPLYTFSHFHNFGGKIAASHPELPQSSTFPARSSHLFERFLSLLVSAACCLVSRQNIIAINKRWHWEPYRCRKRTHLFHSLFPPVQVLDPRPFGESNSLWKTLNLLAPAVIETRVLSLAQALACQGLFDSWVGCNCITQHCNQLTLMSKLKHGFIEIVSFWNRSSGWNN